MNGGMIDRLCNALVRKYGTGDPFIIAEMLGICVEYDNLRKLKGYYCYMNRVRMIVINAALDDQMKRLVCAHELGHDRLHLRMAMASPLRDEGFHSTAKTELEANRFAAGLLVPDDEFIQLASYGYTDKQIAMELGTFPEIVQIKARSLFAQGIQLRLVNMPNSKFLKTL